MIIYNVTVKVDNDVHDEWMEWMRSIHIPEVMATQKFIDHQVAKVLVDDADGITYSFQYKCQSMDELEEYYAEHAPALQRDHAERYKDKFVAFRTLLEVI
ncbi:MAG TPA: DUF4286 domain-containing protein [Flavobacteriales bacterium]|nr:DUF4286 domain-containing protein [Flavobacteriales bacterium]